MLPGGASFVGMELIHAFDFLGLGEARVLAMHFMCLYREPYFVIFCH